MPSVARAAFIEGIASLEQTLEERWAVENTPRGAFVRRGLTVASYNLLETFILERLDEIAKNLNMGNLQYIELPDQQKLPSVRAAIGAVSARSRRLDDVEMERLAIELSQTLSSADTNRANFSALSWTWSGSNMSVDDYSTALKRFHVKDCFGSVSRLSQLMGFPMVNAGSNDDLKNELRMLATERHMSAHQSAHAISTMWLKTVGRTLLKFGSCFDILASIGSSNLKSATPEYLSDDRWTDPSRARFHIVLERRQDYALYNSLDGQRARRVDVDGGLMFRDALRNPGLNDVVIMLDKNKRLTDWSIPLIG